MTRKIQISLDNYVRYEFIYEYIFRQGLQLTLMELRLLVLLHRYGDIDFGNFCRRSVKVLHPEDRYGNKSQNIRNVINKMVSRGFVIKEKEGKRNILKLSYDISAEQGVIYETKIKIHG